MDISKVSAGNAYANRSTGDVQKVVSDTNKSKDNNAGASIKEKPADVKSQIVASDNFLKTGGKQQAETTSKPNQSVMANDQQKDSQDSGKVYSQGGQGKERAEANVKAMVGGDKSATAAKDSSTVVTRQQFQEQQHGKDDQNTTKDNMSNNSYSNRVANRRRKPFDEEDEEGDNRRRRRPAQLPFNQQRKETPSVIEGAMVGESKTQDMFVSSAFSQQRITGKVNKSVIEQIKEYSGNDVYDSIYNIVSANYNHKEKNGIGPNMQRELFGEMLSYMSDIDDVLTPEYKRFVRNVIQGAMTAGLETKLDMKDLTKMLVSGFMAMSPHDDDPYIMTEVIKNIVNEILYGKINIGYNMKSASYWLGAASYTLVIYYKNYQNDIEFNRDLEQKLNIAFSENIWNATGEISNFSQATAKANVEQFMAGRLEEEKIHNKNYVKDMVFSPLKKVFNR